MDKDPLICMRVTISGKVQGVFFRASARNEAQRLGVSGYAKNLADGRVEVLACGGRAQVERLYEWLQRGPAHAEVTSLASELIGYYPCSGFQIL
jgi:acylphosphatase